MNIINIGTQSSPTASVFTIYENQYSFSIEDNDIRYVFDPELMPLETFLLTELGENLLTETGEEIIY